MLNSDIVYWCSDLYNLAKDEAQTVIKERIHRLRDRFSNTYQLMNSGNSPTLSIPIFHSNKDSHLHTRLEEIQINENVNLARMMDKPIDQSTLQAFVQSIYKTSSRTNQTVNTSSHR